MRRFRRHALPCALVSGLLMSGLAAAEVDFRAASAGVIGKSQREYIERLLDAKPKTPDQTVKSLMAMQAVATSVGSRPLIDVAALSRDKLQSAEIWHRYAEKLYVEERYAQAEEALRRVDDSYRETNAEALDTLQIKLALRGLGNMPPPKALKGTGAGDPLRDLNLALGGVSEGELTTAVTRLRAIAADPRRTVEIRHRAMVLVAALLYQLGSRLEALAALSQIDGASIFQVDTLIAYLRINEAVNPAQAAAVEKQVARRSPNSPLVWESRERMVRALRAQGAEGQASEVVSETIGAISATLISYQKETSRVDQMSVDELLPRSSTLPEARKARVDALLQQRDALQKTVRLMRRWQPYIIAYLDRLSRDRTRFEDEIREAQFSTSGEMERDSSRLASLFHLEMSKLVGKPMADDTVYRLFFGLVNWEFAYEYPVTWRPLVDSGGKQTDRRRRRGVAQQRENDDSVFLPMAMAHVEKLAWKIAERLAAFPRHSSTSLAETLVMRSAEKAVEIERMLPFIDEGIRHEIIQDVRDRKGITEQWLNFFAAQAISDYAKIVPDTEMPFHSLVRTIAPRRGESLVRAIESVAGEVGSHRTKEVALAPIYDALRPLTQSGESRQIRADALRMRAQLGVSLYEAQAINSPADAIDHYTVLLRDYPDLVDVADTTYQLARAQDLGQQLEKSLATLESFAKKFPDDPRSNEAFFRIAEYQFSLSEYLRAKPAYELVIKQGDRRYVDQAEYKLAWTLFKMGDFRGALPKFVHVIDRGYGDEGGDDLTRRNRMQDALRATALTFSNLEGATEIERYFTGLAQRPYVPEIYQTLARYYLDHRRVADGSKTYTLLDKHYPNHAQAPVLLADLVIGARRESLAKLSLELQELFVNRYSITSPYWEAATEDTRKQILGHMKPFAGQLAQMYHADAQQQKKPESYALAIKYYSQYVKSFPDDKETPAMHFLLADARFETGDLENAILDYEKLAYGYGAHEKAAESGYALLVATQKLIEKETDVAQRKIKLAALVARSAKFSSVFPGDLRVEAVLAKAGEDILAVGDPLEAIRISEDLLARNPSEQIRRRASQVLAHGLFESGSFARAEAAYVKALAFKGIPPKDATEMNERLGLSVYRQAEALVAAGNPNAAIEMFLRVGKTAPGTEAVPNAVIDAAVLLANAKRWPEAILLLEEFPKRFPGNKLAATIPLRLAVAYENDGRFLLAADSLEGLSKTETDVDLARQMQTRAAELREKGGRTDLAVATYERYLQRYPLPIDRASEIRQLLADFGTKASDIPTRDRWLNEIVRNAKTPAGQESIRARFLAAKASVVLGDDQGALFHAIKLKLPLNKTLPEKRKAMEGTLRWYEEASRFGVLEVTTEATFKTAEVYRVMARDIMSSDRPPELNELELSQYNLLLEEQSAPIEEKATEIHEINYGRIAKGTYDDWVKRSLVSLRGLFAGKYDKVEAAPGYFPYTAPAAVPANGSSGVVPGGDTSNKASGSPPGVKPAEASVRKPEGNKGKGNDDQGNPRPTVGAEKITGEANANKPAAR